MSRALESAIPYYNPSGAKGTNPRPLINRHMFRVITFQLLQLHEVG